MSAAPPGEETLRAEAAAAWAHQSRRGVVPDGPALALLAAVVGVGVTTLVAVGARLALLFAERPGALAVVLAVDAALVLLLVGGALRAWRRAEARAAARVARARARRRSTRCPRCAAPLLARSVAEVGARACGACGATLLEAWGLVVVHVSSPRWRRRRWRAAARARLGEPGRAAPSPSPVRWLGAVTVALGVLWSTAALVGGAVGLPPRAVEAPLGLDREVPHHGRAFAQPVAEAGLPPGPTTRPRAPLWVGTQVLARKGRGPHHQLAVIVRVDAPRAFVVWADGDSDWVARGDLLAPELAVGDAVEVFDGAAYAAARLVGRVGSALRVRREDGTEGWTDASRIRVRSDARHARGEGLESEIPPGAWVEVRVEEGAWRPGLGVASEGGRLAVALSDGSVRWVPADDVRRQALGPGMRVWVDGWSAPAVVAARIGHALAVVDPEGARGWTALSRVRRP